MAGKAEATLQHHRKSAGNHYFPDAHDRERNLRPFSKFENLRGALGRLPAITILGGRRFACEVRPNADCLNKKHPSEYLKSNVLIDTIIISEEGLRHLVAEVGSGQVVFGTDMPLSGIPMWIWF